MNFYTLKLHVILKQTFLMGQFSIGGETNVVVFYGKRGYWITQVDNLSNNLFVFFLRVCSEIQINNWTLFIYILIHVHF